MIQWTKQERESARVVCNLTYKMGKVKMQCKPLTINPAIMTGQDFNTFVRLLEKYGRENKRKLSPAQAETKTIMKISKQYGTTKK